MRKLIVLVLVSLALPSSLSARIVPDACIDGIGLWDSSARVTREWGQPLRKTREGIDQWWYYRTGAVLLTTWKRPATPANVIVLAIRTSDASQRTPAGIGPGSTLREVRSAYRGRGCPRQGTCEIGNLDYRSTALTLKRGRVTDVSISLYSDYDDGLRQKPDPRCRASG